MRLNLATRTATLPPLFTENLTADFDPTYPPYYALGALTGLPGYGSLTLPVLLTVCAAGVGVYDLDGYYLGGAAYPRNVPNAPAGVGVVAYGAALGVASALPINLTYSALTAAGFDFDPVPNAESTGSAYVLPLGASLTVNAATPTAFTVTPAYGKPVTVTPRRLGSGTTPYVLRGADLLAALGA